MSSGKTFIIDLVAYILADVTVSGLIGNRLYALRAPQNPTTPYVVWQKVSADEGVLQDGPTGLEEYRVQFSIYSKAVVDCEDIRDAIKDRINGFTGTMGSTQVGFCMFDNEVDGFEDTTEEKNKIIDFRFMLESA